MLALALTRYGSVFLPGAAGTDPPPTPTPTTTTTTVVEPDQVIETVEIGSRPAGSCDPNYTGACVPIASDVDCAGGSGNGPAYVTGPVHVVGTDVYELDRDRDGVGCE